jgi:pimeloyl-ACP methyl ester carboxylesterase
MEARRELMRIGELSYCVRFWGPPSDDPIVLLHGFLDTGATFEFLVEELPRGWSFAAPDWRGFGDSEWTRRPYWFPDYFADLDLLLDAIVPRRPAVLVGHSMGGNIASQYAGVRRDRVRALVSLEGFGLPRSRPDQVVRRLDQWLTELRQVAPPKRYAGVAELAAVLTRRNPRLSRMRAERVAAAWLRPLPDGGFELASDPWHRLVNPVLARREELEAFWREIAAEVLLVLAELSDVRNGLGEDGSNEYFHRFIRRLDIVTLAGVGHMMHHEDPALVARTLRPFLERQL